MILETLLAQTLVALLGGVGAELLHWYSLSRKSGRVAKYKTKPLYWGTTLGMIVFGGIMPLLYIQGAASALLCFHLGAATPIVMQKLVSSIPSVATAQGARESTSLADFFSW